MSRPEPSRPRAGDPPPMRTVIATAGGNRWLERTLRSLAEVERPAGYRGLLVAENGPPSGVERLVASLPREASAEYVHVEADNKSAALNAVLPSLRGELVFFSDDDVRFAPGLLTSYADAARGVSRGEYYGGPLEIDWEGEPAPDWLLRYLPKTARGWRLPHTEKTPLRSPLFLGPNWAAFADDLLDVEGFDPRLGPGAETGSTGQESDAQARLADAGVQGCYVPGAVAWHYVRSECGTVDWALARAHRHGIEWGIRRATRRPIASSPPVVWFRRGWSAVKSMPASFSSDRRRRFKREFHLAKWNGRFEGLALGRDWRLHGRD